MVREKLSGKERARLEKLGLTEEEIASCEVLAFQSGEYICREGEAIERLLMVEESWPGKRSGSWSVRNWRRCGAM